MFFFRLKLDPTACNCDPWTCEVGGEMLPVSVVGTAIAAVRARAVQRTVPYVKMCLIPVVVGTGKGGGGVVL